MSDPTAPDSESSTEPDVEPAPAADSGTDADPDTDTDVYAEPDADPVPAPASESPAPSRQLLFIAAALVVALTLGGGLFLIFRGDDEPKKVSSEDQAKSAAVSAWEGIYKIARKESGACEQLAEVLALTPEQSGFLERCLAQAADTTSPPPAITIESVTPTQVTVDDAAGTGTVTVELVTSQDGKRQTEEAPTPVVKIDGRWKVQLNPGG